MNLPKKEFFLTDKEVITKIYAYCSYQERCQSEVRLKLHQFKLNSDDIEGIISKLIVENYINEERFAIQYAGGKFRIKNWGKRKIAEALKHKEISNANINIALKEIDDQEYQSKLQKLADMKWNSISENDLFKKRNIIATYLINKGYEQEFVWNYLLKRMD